MGGAGIAAMSPERGETCTKLPAVGRVVGNVRSYDRGWIGPDALATRAGIRTPETPEGNKKRGRMTEDETEKLVHCKNAEVLEYG